MEIIGLNSIAPAMSSQIKSIASTIASSITSVQLTDEESAQLDERIESNSDYINLGTTVFHAVVLALCILALVATSITVFCSKADCRYFIYGVCALMVLVTILGMIVALVLSVVMPAVYITCSVADDGLSSPANFNSTPIGLCRVY